MYFKKFLSSSSLSLLLLSGCSFMPSTGPHASFILDKKVNSVPVKEVNEALAASLWEGVENSKEKMIQDALVNLRTAHHERLRIAPGDEVDVLLWIQGGQSESVLGNAPQPRTMGTFTVSMRGTIDLPYIGETPVGGLSPEQAEKVVSARYARTHLFPQVEASLKIENNKAQNVIVMGAVNTPTVVNWSEAGLGVSEVVAKAGGYKVFDPTKQGSDIGVNDVQVIRDGITYKIPMKTALSEEVPLQAGDRLLLQHTPVVRALCLGAGWTTPTSVSFDEIPSLAQVLANAGGMNPGTAQGRAVFVLKKKERIIYYINFDKVEGMKASQHFPVENQDVVYIPSARSVTLQQAVNIIMSIGYPAAMGAAIK